MADESVTTTLRLLRRVAHTPTSSLLTFAPRADDSALGFVPGQIGALSNPLIVDSGETLIAIASPPSASREIDFLVKSDSNYGYWLTDLVEGDEITMRGPVGRGFPVDDFEGKDLLFVAMGTAIAPVRSAVRHAIERRTRFARIAVVYGARSPDQFAFADEFDRWRSADVKLDLTVTNPGDLWAGATGRVQNCLEEAVRHTLDATAFVCGSETMMDETADALVALGLTRDLVLRNY